jgi:hypothetical protein
MLDDLLTSCALVLVAAGVVAIGSEIYIDTRAPDTTAAALEVIELPTVVVIGRRDTRAAPELIAAAE